MKSYTVILIQLIIWSGYNLMEWLSKRDQPIYNILMFLIFFYLAIMISNTIIRSTKKTFVLTFLSLIIYSSFHLTLVYMN
ncbi:hypothetical protein [Bacillus massilinigeriensis]|uniref:hypothetical protein n=1 Tax=Bacillus massilionigeriensis TaxID=1805475 RepID=UPI00096ADD09|nr:hypothetical protein [Bacillus massilionigeriensis]